METPKMPPHENRNMWDDIRQTVREGMREIRDKGDELARQARLRMDIFQTERRLKTAYESLGEASYRQLCENRPATIEDPAIAEHMARIRYYGDELTRLHEEQKRTPDHTD
jgi:hypothetical protein